MSPIDLILVATIAGQFYVWMLLLLCGLLFVADVIEYFWPSKPILLDLHGIISVTNAAQLRGLRTAA